MSQPTISVCVHIRSDADPLPIQRAVVGNAGKLRVHSSPTRFWALTTMTLKNVQALDGVKSCTLSPRTW